MKEPITVKELDSLMDELFKKKDESKEKEQASKKCKAELASMQSKIAEHLEELGKDSYKSEAGSFSYKLVESFLVPKDDANRELFFGYLKEKGVFDQMITVNSATMNTFANAEADAAAEDGNFDFQVPGLQKSTPRHKFSMRK